MNVYLFDGHFITLCLFFSKFIEINVEMAAGLTKALAEGSAVKREHVIVIERGREDKSCCTPCCLNCLSHCCFSNCFCCPFWFVLVAMIILFVVIVPVIMLVKPVAVKPVSSPYTTLNNTWKPVSSPYTALNNTWKPVSSPYTAFNNTRKQVSSPYTALGNTTQDNAIIHEDGFNHSAMKDVDARHTVGVEVLNEIKTAGKYRARSKYCISLTNFISFHSIYSIGWVSMS